MIGAVAIGCIGILSGAWQAASGDAAGVGAIISGTALLGIGGYGLKKVRADMPEP